MLRGIHLFTATVAAVGVLAGCSGGAAPDTTATTSEAVAASPVCRHGGTATVSLLSFDASTLVLTAVDAHGLYVTAHVTASTIEVAANLRNFPPDPIFPQCGNDAAAYDKVLGAGLSRDLLAAMGSLAADSCNATITLSATGSVVSFQPVP